MEGGDDSFGGLVLRVMYSTMSAVMGWDMADQRNQMKKPELYNISNARDDIFFHHELSIGTYLLDELL